jgi:hypothetical protein
MREKLVKRFYCDFCKKARLQKRAMVLHETNCTMNPNRGCRACTLVNGGNGCDLRELIAILPDPAKYHGSLNDWQYSSTLHAELESAIDECLPKLRELADSCPACILAALRQKKIPIYMAKNFDYSKEMKEVFAMVNEERSQCAGHYYG